MQSIMRSQLMKYRTNRMQQRDREAHISIDPYRHRLSFIHFIHSFIKCIFSISTHFLFSVFFHLLLGQTFLFVSSHFYLSLAPLSKVFRIIELNRFSHSFILSFCSLISFVFFFFFSSFCSVA